jgi:hypothetical protein
MQQITTPRDGERGEGKLGAIIGWIIFLGIFYAGWHLTPAFVANYGFKDKMQEVARRNPGTPAGTDEAITETLVKDARERDLGEWIKSGTIKIQTTPGIGGRRRIYVTYDRELEVLPGYKRVFTFENDIEQPLL